MISYDWLDDFFATYLTEIRAKVTDLIEENKVKPSVFPFYTPHGIEHCKAVENNFHKLIPKLDQFSKLKMFERFCLLASAWLHDIGMLRSVIKEVYSEEKTFSEAREIHHETSAQFIVENWRSLAVHERDKEVLSKLCLNHRRHVDINTCSTEFPTAHGSINLRLLV